MRDTFSLYSQMVPRTRTTRLPDNSTLRNQLLVAKLDASHFRGTCSIRATLERRSHWKQQSASSCKNLLHCAGAGGRWVTRRTGHVSGVNTAAADCSRSPALDHSCHAQQVRLLSPALCTPLAALRAQRHLHSAARLRYFG